ncbi:hypothetical protein D3C73_885270 [compost metagenome]
MACHNRACSYFGVVCSCRCKLTISVGIQRHPEQVAADFLQTLRIAYFGYANLHTGFSRSVSHCLNDSTVAGDRECRYILTQLNGFSVGIQHMQTVGVNQVAVRVHMEITGASQERCLLIIGQLNQEEAVTVDPQVSRIVCRHRTTCQMQSINRTDTYTKTDLFSIHPACSAIYRCRDTGCRLAHNVFEHYAAGFKADGIYVGNIITDYIELRLEPAHA